ncbi:hypothetical protein DFH09DRAFT_1183964 [Mycena vulgaris]|nr:hypothetical protein DFH09DRAFT_1183955 [Mycena vulgaris]KAJ6530835.1 hypothetical protein DFH09DRAFT_1183964 [Mycena vulgaris]
MAEQWRNIELSDLLPRLSQSKDNLKRSLRNQPIYVAECNQGVEELEKCINDVTDAFARGHFDQLASRLNSQSSPLIKQLLEDARRTLWDTIPVYAIANVHKERAEALMSQGNIEGDRDHLFRVYIEYAKYLMLHPPGSPEYTGTCHKVAVLEATMARMFNPAHGCLVCSRFL